MKKNIIVMVLMGISLSACATWDQDVDHHEKLTSHEPGHHMGFQPSWKSSTGLNNPTTLPHHLQPRPMNNTTLLSPHAIRP